MNLTLLMPDLRLLLGEYFWLVDMFGSPVRSRIREMVMGCIEHNEGEWHAERFVHQFAIPLPPHRSFNTSV